MDDDSEEDAEDSIVRDGGGGDKSAKNGYDGSAVGDVRISAVRNNGGSDRGWCGWRGQGDQMNQKRGGGDSTLYSLRYWPWG